MNPKKIYHWLRHPGDSLSQRVVHGGIWVFALRISNRSFQLIRTIILARLLAPEDFGLFGIAMLALSALQSFSQTGFDQALIQKKKDTEPYLDTAWTVQIIRGTLLALILVAGAPLVGVFFEELRAVLLVQVLAVSVFLGSLKNIAIMYFRKELEFHKQFLYQFSGTVADLAIAIPAAFILRSVWALIFGLLARNITKTFISYFLHDYRPSLRFNWYKSKELFSFGRWLLGISILGFVVTQGDDILVGKILTTSALGFYQMAFRIASVPAKNITGTISMVIFPSYSKLQEDIDKVRELFLRVLLIISSLIFPLCVSIFILSGSFTRLFLGEKWLPMVSALRVLSLFGILSALISIFGPLFKGTGNPKYNFFMVSLRTLLLATTIYPLTHSFGIVGTSLSTLLAVFFALPYGYLKVSRILNITLKDVWLKLYPSAIISSFTGLFLLGFIYMMPKASLLGFFLAIFSALVIYLSFSWLFWEWKRTGPLKAANDIRKTLK